MVPYVLVFTSLEDSTKDLSTAIDALFMFDIVISFFKGYYLGETLVTDLRRIAMRYLFTDFVFDIASTVPTLVTGQS